VGSILLSEIDFQTVVGELLTNSVRAMTAGGGTITLREEQDYFSGESLPTPLKPRKDGYIRVSVTDSGPGIPAELVPHIFEPFLRRSASNPHTGLGLATVEGIMNGAGGGVALQSSLEDGTRVELYFPAHLLEVAKPPTLATPLSAPLILVVDDDTAVRTVTTLALKSMGFRFCVAASVTEAKQIFDGQVSLVLTDYAMPEGGGFAVADFIESQSPQTPVIVYSGEGSFLTRPPNVSAILGKPFTFPKLKALINELLGKVAAPSP